MMIYNNIYMKEFNNSKLNQKIWRKIRKMIKYILINKQMNILKNYKILYLKRIKLFMKKNKKMKNYNKLLIFNKQKYRNIRMEFVK